MTNKRILILDNNAAILEVVTEALLYEKFEVRDIALGSQFFKAVRDFKPDLILLDYKLADANGDDLCRELKALAEYQHIPVVIFSAYFHPADQHKPTSCDGILYKPFNLDDLLSIVHRHLDSLPASMS
jgi:DNA-binding response OmpR family regulator